MQTVVAPTSKKRKAEEDLEATTASDTRQDLAKLRSRVATTDPAALRQFIVKKFDDAIESLAPRQGPHSPTPSSATASSITTRLAASSGSASTSTASSSPQHRRVGSISGTVPTSPSISSFVSNIPSTINALSTVFADLIDNDLPPPGEPPLTPAATATSSPTIPRSLPSSSSQPPPPTSSLVRDVHMASVSLPSRIIPSTPPASVPGTTRTSDTLSKLQQGSRRQEEPEEEDHCVRCHSDLPRSVIRSGTCVIEHNMEDYQRISKNGQMSSVWEYKCCGYRFVSPYCDEPEDPNANTDKGMYCFVGRHTTDEEEAASKKMNTYTCEEAGCWEEGSEAD